MGNLARNVLGIQQAAVQPELGTLTVRAPASSLAALNQTLADLLDGKSEVLLDVKIYEVENTRTRLSACSCRKQPLSSMSPAN